MPSSERPWPIPTQPWVQKTPDIYTTLENGKRTSIEAVLHLTPYQYNSISLEARKWMQNNAHGHLGETKIKMLLDDVVNEMKEHQTWGPLLSWVERSGEQKEVVDKAIRHIFKTANYNAKRVSERRKTPNQVPTVAREGDTESREAATQVPTHPQPRVTELHAEWPAVQHSSTQLEQTVSQDERPDYESCIMIVNGDNKRQARLVGVEKGTTLKDIQDCAVESWQSWHGILTKDLDLNHTDPHMGYEIPLWDQKDWVQALRSAQRNKKVLEVVVSARSRASSSAREFNLSIRSASPSLGSFRSPISSNHHHQATSNIAASSAKPKDPSGKRKARHEDHQSPGPSSDGHVSESVYDAEHGTSNEGGPAQRPQHRTKRLKITQRKEKSTYAISEENSSSDESPESSTVNETHVSVGDDDTPLRQLLPSDPQEAHQDDDQADRGYDEEPDSGYRSLVDDENDDEVVNDSEHEVDDVPEGEWGQDLTVRPKNLRPWVDVPIGEIQHHLSYYPHSEDRAENVLDDADADASMRSGDQIMPSVEDNLNPEGELGMQKALDASNELARSFTDQFDATIEAEMWDVLKLKPQEHGEQDRILLPGHVRKAYQYQVYGAWRLLRAERHGLDPAMPPCRTFILADIPGFGKSCTIALFIWLSAQITHALEEVRLSRANGDNLHLAEDAPDDAECQSEPFAVRCPCSKGSPTSRIEPLRGLIQLVVPPKLVSNTFLEWYNQIGDNQQGSLHFDLFNCTAMGQKPGKAIFYAEDKKKRDLFDFRLNDVTLKQLLKETKAEEAEEAEQDDLPEVESALSTKIIVTTPNSYAGHITKRRIHLLPFGRIIRDEFHEEAKAETHIITAHRTLAIRRTLWQPYQTSSVLYASGTPTDSGPAGLYGFVSLALLAVCRLENTRGPPIPSTTRAKSQFESWYRRNLRFRAYEPYLPDRMHKMKLRIQSEDSKTHEKASQEFALLMKNFYLARGHGSRWKGVEIMPLPRMRYSKVIVQTSAQYLNEIRKAIQPKANLSIKAQQSMFVDKRNKVIAFPYLATLYKQGVLTLHGSDFSENKWDTTKLHHAENPFLRHSKKLGQSSAKTAEVFSILKQFSSRTDFRKRPAAGIIFTGSSFSASALYHQIRADHDKDPDLGFKPYLVTSNVDTESSKDGTKLSRAKICEKWKNHEGPTVLIGTASVIGTGLTLTRAIFTILFDQQSQYNLVIQCIGRMHRKTNCNWEGLYVFELFDSSSIEDTRLRALREGKSNLVGKIEAAMALEAAAAEAEAAGPHEGDDDDDDVTDTNGEQA